MEQLYKLLLVDDEPIICRGLASFSWEKLGYKVCGTASDGQECLDLMEHTSADVVITDIQMPVMDGLTLAQRIHTKYPKCRIILLTGFKSFDYAQRAIKSDVVDYLVKPVDLAEMEELMKRLKQELDEEQLFSSSIKNYMEQLDESLPHAIKNFLHSIVFNRELDITELEEKMSLLELSFPYPYYVAASLKFEQAGTGRSKGAKQEEAVLSQFIADHTQDSVKIYFFLNSGQELILLINFEVPSSSDSTYALMEALIENLHKYYEKCAPGLAAGLTIGAGNIYRNIVSYSASYAHACEALKRKFFNTEQTCFFAWQERSTLANVLTEYPYDLENKLIDSILVGKAKETLEYLDSFQKECCLNIKHLTQEHIQYTYQQFFLMLNRRLTVHGIMLSDIIGMTAPFSEFFLKYPSLKSLQDAVRELLLKTVSLIDKMDSQSKTSSHLAVRQALEYMHRHYSEKISLSQIADHVHLNSSYLSLQFKNEFGRNFIEMLKEYRIEKAKELLRNPDYKVYEICSMVGYTNPNYFTDTFRIQTGMTPLEYRKRLT